MIIAIIGVAGSGKTTIGTMLAGAVNCPFLDGDSLHSKENIDKMSQGIPLTDADRAPWLAAIHACILDRFERGQDLVVACSALKQRYRTVLAGGVPITWVYLKGPFELIRTRLKLRPGHFMKADMLASQFDALEEPSDALVIDVSASPSVIVERILSQLLRPDVRVFADLRELSLRVAEAAVSTLNDAVRRAGRCSLVLSGGHSAPVLRLAGIGIQRSDPVVIRTRLLGG
jgi:gluconokinase